jgi:hypothetical protein
MRKSRSIVAIAISLGVAGGVALADQDRYSLSVPNGLAFSEFKGYETWQVASVSQARDKIEVILGNPEMIKAFESGLPAEGKTFPDGVRMAKIHWLKKTSDTDPNHAIIPDTLHDIDFMVKDSKRFAATGGWGYAEFDYDNANEAFKPLGTGPACGYACHTLVKTKDYVFTAFPKR